MATTSAIIKINLEIEGGKTLALNISNLKELRSAIKTINETRITLDPRSPNFQAASNQLKQLQSLYKGVSTSADTATVQIDQFNKELNEPPKAVGYYRQLSAQLAVLKNQYKDLNQADLQGKIGQNLGRQINGINDKLKAMDASVGTFGRSVGNYKQSIQGIGSAIAPSLVAGGGIVLGVSLIKDAMTAGIGQSIKYEKALDNLSALTGLQGEGLANLDGIARGLQNIEVEGSKIVNTGPEILQALKLVGSARPELLKDAAALGEVTKAAIILSKASGDDLKTSVAAITETMAQFGLKAKDAPEIINLLAAGAKEGKIEVPQLTEQIERLGPSAKNSNVSLTETIALFEDLAENGLKGERASVQLRNVLVKLASAEVLPRNAQKVFKEFGIDAKVLADNTIPIADRLRALAPIIGNTSALVRIFGVENVDAASILSASIPRYEQLKTAVTGTGEAFRQAGINADNAASKLENLEKGALNKLEETFGGATTSGGFLIDTLDFLIQKMDLFGVITSLAVGPMQTFFSGARKGLESIKALGDVSLVPGIGFGIKAPTSKPDSNAFKLEDEFFPKFADTSQLDAADKTIEALKKVTEATGKAGRATKDKKVEDLGAADSIARLTKRVSELQDALSKAPQSGIAKATLDLVLAEQALARAKAREQEARNPTRNLTEVQQAEAGLATLGVSIDNPQNEADAKAQLDALAKSLAGGVGVTMPVDIDTEEARKEFEAQKYFLDQENKLKADNAEAEAKRKSKQQQQNQEFLDAGLQAASQFNNQLAAQETARVDAALEHTKEALQLEFDGKRAAAQGNAVIIANLDKQQKERQLIAEKAAAREKKKIALKQALIEGALAVIRAAPNYIQMAAAAIATAFAVAAIEAQQFYQGGVAKDVANQKGVVKSANMKPTRHGDNRVAFLKVGERVLTKDNQAAIEEQYGADIWRSVGAKDPNSIFGARHGSMAPPVYGAGRSILNVTTNLSREDIGALSKAIAQTNDRMGGVVKSALVEGAKYAARERKATATH